MHHRQNGDEGHQYLACSWCGANDFDGRSESEVKSESGPSKLGFPPVFNSGTKGV